MAAWKRVGEAAPAFEREACAKVADDVSLSTAKAGDASKTATVRDEFYQLSRGADSAASAIRSRGGKG